MNELWAAAQEQEVSVERIPYTAIDNALITDSRLRLQTRALLILMLSCPPSWNFTIRGMAKIAGISKDTMAKMLQELESAGYVERRTQVREAGRFGKSGWVVHSRPVSPCPNSSYTKVSYTKNSPQINNKQVNNKQDIPPYNPPNHSAADLQDEPDPKPKPRKRRDKTVPVHKPDRFEKFWALYPGGGSRQRAAKAWDKLAPDDDLIAQMGAALQRQMDSPMWRKGVGIPYASTWLNGRRWTDKLPPGQGGAPQDHGNDPSGGPKVPVYVRTEIDPVTGEERDVYE